MTFPNSMSPAAQPAPQGAAASQTLPAGGLASQQQAPQAPQAPTQTAPPADVVGGQSPMGVPDANNPQFGGGLTDSQPPTDWNVKLEEITANTELPAAGFALDLPAPTPEQFQQIRDNFNPMQGIEVANVQALMDNNDAQGLMDLIGGVVRGGYATSLQGATQVASNYSNTATNQLTQYNEGQIQRENVRAGLLSANPNLNQPAYQQHFQQVFDSFSRQYQGQELHDAVAGYLNQQGGPWQLQAAAPAPNSAPKTTTTSTSFADFGRG